MTDEAARGVRRPGLGAHWTLDKTVDGGRGCGGGGARGAFSLCTMERACHAPRPPRQWARIRWRRMVTERLEEDFILDLASSRVHAFLHDQTSTIDGQRNVTLHCPENLDTRPRTDREAKRPSVLEGQCSLLRCRLFPEA
jgi:hypothetical protein